jgi:ornithine carbamoyltransferase
MTPESSAHRPTASTSTAYRDDDALLTCARRLTSAFCDGGSTMPLRGKMLCVLFNDECLDAARLFTEAGTELGAHVSCVRLSLTDRSPLDVVRETAALLARLYEAAECVDLSQALVTRLREVAGIPFFMGASMPDHPSTMLASRLVRSGTPPLEARRRILQALLVRALTQDP